MLEQYESKVLSFQAEDLRIPLLDMDLVAVHLGSSNKMTDPT